MNRKTSAGISIFSRMAFCICILFATKSAAQDNKADLIDSLMQHAYRIGVFNGNVLVADQGKVIYQQALGFADASKTNLLTADYRFHIGSIAKEFNAVAVMMLEEKGKLKLDDKVSTYLPELPLWARQITIRNLLQYSSGLPDVKWNSVFNDAENMAELKKISLLDFEPGSKYAYNNNNVFLQRRIVEKITGMSFNDFVKKKLLKPAGMTHAVVDPSAADAFIARSFNKEGKQDSLDVPISGWTAVTLADFYKWSEAINTYKLIGPAATRTLITAFGPQMQAGLGSGVMEGDQLLNHVHDGSARNYQALLVSNNPRGRTVILMTNNRNLSLYDFNIAIQAILDGQPYQEPKKSLTNEFGQKLSGMSASEIIGLYGQLKSSRPNEFNFNDQAVLNEVGYFLLNNHRLDDAITLFEYNTTLFPDSWNVFDSLGEAYQKKGDTSRTLLNYKKSLKLNPENSAAKEVIAALEKK